MSLTPESRLNTSFVVLDNDAYTTSESNCLLCRLDWRFVHKPIIVTKIRSYSTSCTKPQTDNIFKPSGLTHTVFPQRSTFTISAFSFCLSGKLRAENRAQSSTVYINHNTFSARRGGRKTRASVFVCILFQNIKLNQSFNTLDCINMGETCLNKYQEWKWISRRRLLSMWFIYEHHGWCQNRQDIKNTEIMCLAFFIFFFLSERINIRIYITFTFLSKSSWAPQNLHAPFPIPGCHDNCENNKSNMTLTSLTGKSLKATRGARWCCLCHSQSVTDKHHAGSINRLIALSLLPLQCTQSGRLVGVFVKMIDKILSISEAHHPGVQHQTQCEMQTCVRTSKHSPGPSIAGHTAPTDA